MKILKKQLDLKKGVCKPKRQRKARESKALTKEIIDQDDMSSNDEIPNTANNTLTAAKKIFKKEDSEDTSTTSKTEKKEKKKSKKEKKNSGPMHFTANNEPRALDVLGDLDPSIFNEVC